jgi:N-acetyl-anhydromuramyl-L-alanine amidase AmpD
MRLITLIIIHCSAVRPDQTSSAAQIDSWHRKDNHWKFGIGYHYVVRRDGSIEPGRPEWMVGAHCRNHNAHSIGVCYEGGLDIRGQPADTRTEAQKTSLRTLLEELHRRYPKALIVGHRDLDPTKECPGFKNVAREYADLNDVRACSRSTK